MTIYRQLIAENSAENWLAALLAAVAFVVVLHQLQRIMLRRATLTATTTATDNIFSNFLIEVLSATRIFLAIAVGLYVATHFLTLPSTVETYVNRIFIALMLLQSGLWVRRCLDFWLRQRFSQGEEGEEGARAMTRSLLSFLGRVVLWALVGLLILDNMGLNVTTLVTSLGIGGIAVALAAQSILTDLFASLAIAIDKPFVIGDFIIVDDLMGTVEHVGLKTTRIRSLSGEQIVFSNTDLLKSRIRNYKRMQERRAVFVIGVVYDTPPAQLEIVQQLIEQAILAQVQTRFDRAHFRSFGPSSLDFEAVYYVLTPDYNLYMDIQHAINLQLVRAFSDRGISFALPTRTLHLAEGLQLARPLTTGE